MEQVSMIGIDLAKNSFRLHGARSDGSVAFRKKLSRAKALGFPASQQHCTVAMEACGGAHHWGRKIGCLGHAVQLAPFSPHHKRRKLHPRLHRRKNQTNQTHRPAASSMLSH